MKISFDIQQLYKDFLFLLEIPGPTQACVKLSEGDPRINESFPIEKAINSIIKRINKDENVNLMIIRHMGNLLIVGGFESKYENIVEKTDLNSEDIKRIKEIKTILGAHLDEITYIVTDKKGFLNGKNLRVLPLCNPPKITNEKPIESKNGKEIAMEIYHPDCRIVGFRNGEFCENIGQGILYKVYKVKKEKTTTKIPMDGLSITVMKRKKELAKHLILKVIKENNKYKIKVGDLAIQDYGDWKEKKEYEKPNQRILSKAIDDRLGCIAVIYTVKELAKKGIKSKAILTSAEEGIPLDTSWGRLVRPSYKEFCTNDIVTIICDGADGKELEDFADINDLLSTAIVIPYTSAGKGGGDIGIFSRFRDNIIPKLNTLYGEEVARATTDYVSRSFEVKIMDDYSAIGFVQWSCGIPTDKTSICHNEESVCLYQIVNIIRTLCYSVDFFQKNG